MQWIISPLGAVMRLCCQWTQQYGLALILFTLATKIILFPVSLWVHQNGIRMVRLMPRLNRIKVKHFGDADAIAEAQGKLYQEEKYSPLLGTVPVLLQLVLLIGLIQVVYHPLTYILRFPQETIQGVLELARQSEGIDLAGNAAELLALNVLKDTAFQDVFLALPGMTAALLASAQGMNMTFLGFDLAAVPMAAGGLLLLVPVLAGLAAVMLCLAQNRINPLQAEQSKASQLGTMMLSVGISLVLGFMIPAGVGFYWIISNLLSIVQQWVLNRVYRPEKHIDYAELEASRQELARYQNVRTASKQDWNREKADYKRFFSVVNKHIVFYSESNGFYKYFEKTIDHLLANTTMAIHYVTSDPDDQIFRKAQEEPRIKPYYIGEKKLITLLMKLEADVVVMTMSDLENYHYKRSYLRKDMEYVYMFHYPLSTHMVLHTGALDHYDTILCVGEFQFAEIRKQEELYHLPEKKLIACGYGQLEKLHEAYQAMEKTKREQPKVLIAPSWQEGNILDSCLDPLLKELMGQGFQLVVRPHPEYMKRYGPRMEQIVQQYQNSQVAFELDFTSNTSIFDSDVVISDWSGTSYEFSFVTGKPSVFVDTPPKIHNPQYRELGIEPLEFTLRDKIGIRVDPACMDGLADRLRALVQDDSMRETILTAREEYIANFGHSGQVAGDYLIGAIQAQIARRKK